MDASRKHSNWRIWFGEWFRGRNEHRKKWKLWIWLIQSAPYDPTVHEYVTTCHYYHGQDLLFVKSTWSHSFDFCVSAFADPEWHVFCMLGWGSVCLPVFWKWVFMIEIGRHVSQAQDCEIRLDSYRLSDSNSSILQHQGGPCATELVAMILQPTQRCSLCMLLVRSFMLSQPLGLPSSAWWRTTCRSWSGSLASWD